MADQTLPPASEQTPDPRDPAAKARGFPTGSGVYLMKDAGGNVIYVGKAKNLRSRASSYFAKDLKDDKTFPYLQIRTREEFPRVEITRRPRRKGVRLYGPFTGTKQLRIALNVLQRLLQFRTCQLDIRSTEEKWRWFRPCLLHSIRRCTAPCNFRVSREDYRRQIKKLVFVL